MTSYQGYCIEESDQNIIFGFGGFLLKVRAYGHGITAEGSQDNNRLQ
jgi:hypothetical protein